MIENEILNFTNNDLVFISKKLQLNDLQKTYLKHLISGDSLQKLVEHFYSLGWLVHFSSLADLIEKLHLAKLVSNPQFISYMDLTTSKNSVEAGGIASLFSLKTKRSEALGYEVEQLPFIRSLHPDLRQLLLEKKQILSVPKGTTLIEQGARDRDLYFLLSGEVYVYYRPTQLQRLRLAILKPGSVFGEIGFLLNKPRAADVVCIQDSKVLKISMNPKLDQLVQAEKASSLQMRFWAIHAFLNSEILSQLPEDYFDRLLFAGKVIELAENETLFKERDISASLYIVIQGSLGIIQGGHTINVMKQGACLGEIAIFKSGGKRTATAKAMQKTLVLEIPQQQIYQILASSIFLARDLEQLAEARLMADQQRRAK